MIKYYGWRDGTFVRISDCPDAYKENCVQRALAFDHLKSVMDAYYELTPATWARLQGICRLEQMEKNAHLLQIGDIPREFYFVCQGIFRAYALGGENFDKEITKNFFDEGRFPASVIALLRGEESRLAIQALEDSVVIRIDHDKYRGLLSECEDLKWYHILYLEKNWVMEKEPQELALLGSDSPQRYLEFIAQYPNILGRVRLHHIASRLGITPTQLSRIRKNFE
tara:strand:- start:6983 stop:7657 length:675 start_codon:yes stop_codon:yes gene_type:complete